MPQTIRQVTLHYQDAHSDKIYQVFLREVADGFVVDFAYGRRGSALKAGTKTQAPVTLARAESVFDKLVASKEVKGYLRIDAQEEVAPPRVDDTPRQHSWIQLLNPIDESDVDALIDDPDWIAQMKFDGERRLLVREQGECQGFNRRGVVVGLPTTVLDGAQALPRDFRMDGEAIDGTVFVFDLLAVDGRDLRATPLRDRLARLEDILVPRESAGIRLVPTARSAADKRYLFDLARESGREGVVFKRASALHSVGAPSSGGDHLKFKFYSTTTVRVMQVNEKRSVSIAALDLSDRWVDVGNVTVPANQPIPEPGSYVEVRYLYAYEGGSLYQPTLLGIRTDVDAQDCALEQIRIKDMPVPTTRRSPTRRP